MTVRLRHPELSRTVASLSGSMTERDFDDCFGKALADLADLEAVSAHLDGLRLRKHLLHRKQGADQKIHVRGHKERVHGLSGIPRDARFPPGTRRAATAPVPITPAQRSIV